VGDSDLDQEGADFLSQGSRPYLAYTPAAECQAPDFLIGPRNKKNRKKRSSIKNLHPSVQITSQDF
jgi:hypothetical protein